MARNWAAAHGSVWATKSGGNWVMHLFPDTEKFAAHDVLYSVLTKTPWFAEGRGGKIGKIDPATGKVTE